MKFKKKRIRRLSRSGEFEQRKQSQGTELDSLYLKQTFCYKKSFRIISSDLMYCKIVINIFDCLNGSLTPSSAHMYTVRVVGHINTVIIFKTYNFILLEEHSSVLIFWYVGFIEFTVRNVFRLQWSPRIFLFLAIDWFLTLLLYNLYSS